jgi:type I site-specific restriction endonuclease
MPRSGINENEASAVDLRVYKELEALGWQLRDTMLYQPSYALTPEQQKEFPGRKSIKPEFVLQDFDQTVLAVVEDKLDDPNKALPKLRLLYSHVLRPRFLYACSRERNLFYDMAWKGVDAGEFRPVSNFLSLEDMRLKITQERQKAQDRPIVIDKTIAGGFDAAAGKERYFQTECIEALLKGYRNGKGKMLVHMATGLGKTRIAVAFVKALLEYGLAKRVLFVVDRRLLAEQAKDDGFAMISPTYNTAWITTGSFKTHRNKDVHVVVIDTLEMIFDRIPSNFYDLLIVDECHRSVNISRKVIFDHFLCPRIGLTATPRIAVPKPGTQVPDDDLAIMDTYRLFGCETGEPDYKFDIDRGIGEGFLAPYKVKEIKTELTRLAEEKGVEFDYVLDPDERKKIELDATKKLTLEQLNQKYLTENQAKRIAEEIRAHTEYGEKMILFGVSQAHCLMLAKALNEVFNNDSTENPRYAEAVISDNDDLNKALKGWFKKPYQNPRIVVSVDIMSTGVDIPCVRYIGFAALTKSVGKYVQMLGRGTRLDTKTGKFSFQVLDFVGLCKRMEDDGKGSPKPNTTVVGPGDAGGGSGASGPGPRGEWFIVDNPDPAHLIQRVMVHEGAVRVVDNIPVEEARRIFEEQVKRAADPAIAALKQKAEEDRDYEPTDEELAKMSDWVRKPDIYMDEGQLQKIYDYTAGSVWDFFLDVLGVKKIPTSAERVERGFETYLSTYSFTEKQVEVLRKIKDVFVANITSHGKVDIESIFANPIYERLIGRFDEVNRLFDGNLKAVIDEMQRCFKTAA